MVEWVMLKATYPDGQAHSGDDGDLRKIVFPPEAASATHLPVWRSERPEAEPRWHLELREWEVAAAAWASVGTALGRSLARQCGL